MIRVRKGCDNKSRGAEGELEDAMLLVLKKEDDAMSQSHQKPEKTRKQTFLWSLQKAHGPADTLILRLLTSRTMREKISVVLSH